MLQVKIPKVVQGSLKAGLLSDGGLGREVIEGEALVLLSTGRQHRAGGWDSLPTASS